MAINLSDWKKEMEAQALRVKQLVAELTEEQLNLSPAPKKWSIGELLDHLTVTNHTFIPVFTSIANGSYQNPRMLAWKVIPKALGRMVIQSITEETKRKYKTVSVFKPQHVYHTFEVRDKFIACQRELIKLTADFKQVDLDQVWIPSPASKWVIYTLSDALSMLLDHKKRHLGQAELISNQL